jgi:hypothetical protein
VNVILAFSGKQRKAFEIKITQNVKKSLINGETIIPAFSVLNLFFEVKFMGQVVLEIPQNVNRPFRIESEECAAAILEQLENDREDKTKRAVASGAIKLPTQKRTKEIGDDVLGIWADRPETGQEIARRIRDRNNGKDE